MRQAGRAIYPTFVHNRLNGFPFRSFSKRLTQCGGQLQHLLYCMNQRKREAALPEQRTNARLWPPPGFVSNDHGVSVEQSESAELLAAYR